MPGPAFTNFVVDSTTTLTPGQPATVAASFDGNAVRLTFGIPAGATGATITSFVVDSVTTLEPVQPATVSASFDGANVRFVFGIPRGNEGAAGQPGLNGTDGAPGPQGPPFTSFVVDGVTTLDPAQPATVTASFDGTNVRLSFGIPRGLEGAPGAPGTPGSDGTEWRGRPMARTAPRGRGPRSRISSSIR